MATAKKVVPIKSAPSANKPGTAVATVKKTSGAVVNIQDMLRAQAAAMNERTAPASGVGIRVTQDKQFVLPNGVKTDELKVVIVDFVARNEFYEGSFDKDNITPPACFAIGNQPNKLVPSDNSPQKQADTCAECPMNAFGSNGKGKACKNGRVLAVLPPDADADTPMWTLKVSPTALKNFDSFVQSVARTFQAPPVAVIATVSFDDNVTYASLRFSDAEPNENVGVHFARQDEAKTLLEQEPDVSQYVAPKPAPARAKGVARR
jgi:hypothetical protein